MKYSDRKTISKAKTTTIATNNKDTLFEYANELFNEIEKRNDIKLLGITFKNLTEFSIRQLSFNLFKD